MDEIMTALTARKIANQARLDAAARNHTAALAAIAEAASHGKTVVVIPHGVSDNLRRRLIEAGYTVEQMPDEPDIRVGWARPRPAHAPGGPGTNTGHGHVWERPDGVRMRCGGPGVCDKCSRDKARWP